jgi:hypothetical protein
MSLCAYCWIRNIESHWSTGTSVGLYATFRCELRDSYIHETPDPNPGGAGYLVGLNSGAADNLIENNIMWYGNKVVVMRGSGGGNVLGYNYTDDALGSYYPSSPEAGINAGHFTTPHMELLEGNRSFNFQGDSFWGNSIYITLFRNHLTALRGANAPLNSYTYTSGGATYPYMDLEGRAAVRMQAYAYNHNFVGNVLGFSGQALLSYSGRGYSFTQTGWTYEARTDPGTIVPMWLIGAAGNNLPDDPTVVTTTLREGNWDWVSQSQQWHGIGGPAGSGTPATLPDSLYLTQKPAFFGSNPWPWVDPATGTVYTLPAKARFDAGRTGAVRFSVANYTVMEGGRVTVAVKRDLPAFAAVTVDYATSDGTAKADVGSTKHDYQPRSGTLTFAPGQTTRTLTVPTNANTLAAGSRTLLLSLTNPVGGATFGRQSTTLVTILDRDKAGTIEFGASAYSAYEGNAYALIRMTRTGGAGSGASVVFTASGGSATPGVNYTEVLAEPVVFGPGQTSRNVTVPLFDDITVDRHKTVNLSLSDAGGGAVLGARSAAVLTILKGNPVLQFSAANFTASESAGKALIAIRRSGLTTDAVSVHYATSPGTASPGVDYQSVSGDVTFGAGATTMTAAVPLVNDGIFEPNRTVLLSLWNPQDLTRPGGAALGQQTTAVVTINDTDSTPRLQFSAAAFVVGERAGSAKVTVIRLLGTQSRVSVDYADAGGGTARAGVNYDLAPGTLTFLPGEIVKTVPIAIHPSLTPVGDLTVNLALTQARGDLDNPKGTAVLGNRSAARLTIRSDDPLLQFSAPTYRIGEAGPQATITVRRSGPTSTPVMVDYYDAGGGSASTPQGYALTPGTLTFPPGILSRSFSVAVTADGLVHPDQTVNLALRNPTGGAALGAQATAVLTLRTTDPKVQFMRSAFAVAESAGKAVVTVRRMGPASPDFTVPVFVSDGTATSANYVPPNPNPFSLDFAKGVFLRSFSVPIVNDQLDAPPPLTVNLALLAPSGALLGSPSTAVLTIADNDVAGVVQFLASNYSVSETATSAVVTVIRTGGLASGATIHYATSDASATAGVHYRPASGAITFDHGETSKTFTIDILDDGTAGGNKTVKLALSSPGGGAILGPRSGATLWIVDGP